MRKAQGWPVLSAEAAVCGSDVEGRSSLLQMEKDETVSDCSPHIANIGRLVEVSGALGSGSRPRPDILPPGVCAGLRASSPVRSALAASSVFLFWPFCPGLMCSEPPDGNARRAQLPGHPLCAPQRVLPGGCAGRPRSCSPGPLGASRDLSSERKCPYKVTGSGGTSGGSLAAAASAFPSPRSLEGRVLSGFTQLFLKLVGGLRGGDVV